MTDFYSGDPGDEHVERTKECACTRCTAKVSKDEYTYPYCVNCYANVDGKCRDDA